MDVLSQQAKSFLPKIELFVFKKKVFTNLCKLEDVIKKTKTILDKYKTQLSQRIKNSVDMSDCESKHSSHTKDSKDKKLKFAEIIDEQEKIFLLTLLTFDNDNFLSTETILKRQQSIQILVG